MALNETDWFRAGQETLKNEGFDHITIRDLCARLKVSTGSFYYHFKNRDDYVGRFFGYWVEDQRRKIAEFSTDPETALQRFNEKSDQLMDHGLEAAMRAWALFDQLAASHLAHFDRERLAYFNELYKPIPNEYRQHVIHLHLCSLIGSQFLIRDPKDIKAFGKFINDLAAGKISELEKIVN